MDKDVEVSRDQNMIVVDGTKYLAKLIPLRPTTKDGCDTCSLHEVEGELHKYCCYIPCTPDERRDSNNVIFYEVKREFV